MDLFRDVLLYASELGLIGKEHFAVDGCKLPSNASKQWSGTHRELAEKRTKLERVAERIVDRHRERDDQEKEVQLGGVPQDGEVPSQPSAPSDIALVARKPTRADKRAASCAGAEAARPLQLLRHHWELCSAGFLPELGARAVV